MKLVSVSVILAALVGKASALSCYQYSCAAGTNESPATFTPDQKTTCPEGQGVCVRQSTDEDETGKPVCGGQCADAGTCTASKLLFEAKGIDMDCEECTADYCNSAGTAEASMAALVAAAVASVMAQ